MSRINLQRVLLGGLVAGLVLNVVDFLVYGVFLGEEFEAALAALGAEMEGSAAMATFITLDFLYGIVLVWLYAAIRPRFGPGPGTAIRAGLVLWVAVALLHAVGEAAMGLFPARLYIIGTVVALFLLPIAAMAGAYFYREDDTAAAAETAY